MFRELVARFRSVWNRNRQESELDEEIRFHLSEEADERAGEGIAPDQARDAARRDFGNISVIRETAREVWTFGGVERLMQDVRYAVRTLRRHHGFSAVVILTLALGIGANTSIFSLFNALILRPLSVNSPEDLAVVAVAEPDRSNRLSSAWSHPVWTQIHDRRQLFDGALAYSYSRFNLAAGGETEFVDGLWASGEFFETLGLSATVGRVLMDADNRRGGTSGPVAVISHEMWRQRFDQAADVQGRTLTVDRVPFTIVGVLTPEFTGPVAGRRFDLVIPLGMASVLRGAAFLDHAGINWLTILIRLRPGQTLQAASDALRRVQPQIRDATRPPGSPARVDAHMRQPLTLLPAGRGNPLAPLRVRAERPLLAMQLAVVLVLLIACANIANLTLARAVTRRRELSLRLALGASRWRLTRQLFIESLVLASLGAAGGLVVAQWGTRVLVQLFATGAQGFAPQVTPDVRVLAFTGAITIGASVLFGMLPALRATRIAPIEALKEQGLTVVERLRLTSVFLVTQIALSLVLVVGGGLLIRTYTNLATMDLGFEAGGVLLVDVDATTARIPAANRLGVFEEVRRAAAALPGVAGAALADLTPVSGAALAGHVEVIGVPSTRGRETFVNRVSPGWLPLFGTAILSGRDFSHTDLAGAQRVAIVNQTFVREFLNGADPLGQVVRQMQGPPGRPPMESEIVGVAADAVYESLRDAVPPTMYVVFSQIDQDLAAAGAAPESASLTVRPAAAPPLTLTRSVAAAIAQVNPQLDLTFRAMPVVVNNSLSMERTLAILTGFSAALSLLMAAVGLYGVTSYAVSRRRAEIGIRMALGASPGAVVRQVLSHVLLLIAVGVVIGAGVSLWVSQFLVALLYGLDPRDPLTLIGAVTLLCPVGVLAGWLPAWRAARVDPMAALRFE